MSDSAAALENVTIRYGRTVAAEAVSLAIGGGAVYALLGRNGAGKSSLIRCLIGQLKPSSGRALLFGKDAWRTRRRAMERVGVVPEEPDAPPEMTASRIARFCSRLYPRWNAAGVADRLKRFGVPENVPFGELSKGQKGQLMLALALAPAPELLVLDDPTLGLDAIARRELYEELIGELADRGTTVFIATHDLSGIEAIADRVGVLRRGRLLLDEGMETLKARFRRIRYGTEQSEARSEYGNELDAFDAVQVRVRGWGVEAVVSNFEEDAFAHFRQIPGIVGPEASSMSLEEIFIAIAGEKKEASR